jgi:hypothetical protein
MPNGRSRCRPMRVNTVVEGLIRPLGPRGRAVEHRAGHGTCARGGTGAHGPVQLRRRGINRPSCETCAGLRSSSVCTAEQAHRARDLLGEELDRAVHAVRPPAISL